MDADGSHTNMDADSRLQFVERKMAEWSDTWQQTVEEQSHRLTEYFDRLEKLELLGPKVHDLQTQVKTICAMGNPAQLQTLLGLLTNVVKM